MAETLKWTVPWGQGGRIDRALAQAWPQHSRSRYTAWLDEGRVRVDGVVVRPAFKVQPGQEVEVDVPDVVAATVEPEDLGVPVLYEDDDLAVVVKPAGMAVHPSAGHRSGTLVNALLHQVRGLSGIGGVERPGIVHRLDLGTSGVMVVAKNDAAHRALSGAFARHDLERRYLALVHRAPLHDSGTFRSFLARDPSNRLKIASVPQAVPEEVEPEQPIRWGEEEEEDEFPTFAEPARREGRLAITHWRVLGRGDRVALVTCRLETGRTHQVRVHLSEAGHPILGDALYARRDCVPPAGLREAVAALPYPMLHAFRLGFRHPITGVELRFEAPPPERFVELARLAKLALPDLSTIKG